MTGSDEQKNIKRRDFSLIKASLKGNSASFAKLMSFYKRRVFYLGKSFFHNDDDCEDFVQDVFLKVWTNLKSFKGDSQFSTWLTKVAWTTAVNSVNRRKEYLPLSDEASVLDTDKTPEEHQIRAVTKEAMQQAIKELPEKYAICIEMYFYYDISYQDISEITAFPVNTVKSNIFRAKKILKEKLGDLYEK